MVGGFLALHVRGTRAWVAHVCCVVGGASLFFSLVAADFGDAFDEAGQIFANVTQVWHDGQPCCSVPRHPPVLMRVCCCCVVQAQLKAARELFTDPKRGILADVMVELSSPVLARRRGVAALLK